jgi:hypothetical protein
MRAFREFADRLRGLVVPDPEADSVRKGPPLLSRFATPHTFSPDLGMGQALLAVAATLTRIFGAVVLFAVCGSAGAFAWSAVHNGFWRVAVELAMLLLFLAAIAALMIAISAVERRVARNL